MQSISKMHNLLEFSEKSELCLLSFIAASNCLRKNSSLRSIGDGRMLLDIDGILSACVDVIGPGKRFRFLDNLDILQF